jgi:hypothetical protein
MPSLIEQVALQTHGDSILQMRIEDDKSGNLLRDTFMGNANRNIIFKEQERVAASAP